jgi:hypothetical protein
MGDQAPQLPAKARDITPERWLQVRPDTVNSTTTVTCGNSAAKRDWIQAYARATEGRPILGL